ncbi:hypothetical protein AMK24_21720 [Streptomyces sp. CB02366]|nr:hypothetical protein AMK24_21720 [Streptomyces sp. CB02366]
MCRNTDSLHSATDSGPRTRPGPRPADAGETAPERAARARRGGAPDGIPALPDAVEGEEPRPAAGWTAAGP